MTSFCSGKKTTKGFVLPGQKLPIAGSFLSLCYAWRQEARLAESAKTG